MSRLRLAPWLLLSAALGTPAIAPGQEREALHLAAGSVARRQIVAVGRDLRVDGEARAGVAALDGDARIVGTVHGDVIVLGGDAELAPTAVVVGDVFVLGGELRIAPGARIEGRSVAYPTFSRAWLTLLEGPSLGLSSLSPLVVAAKLALATAWLALTLLLFATSAPAVAATSDEVRREPLRSFAAGLVGVLALLVSALFLSALLPVLVSLPLLALVVVAALVAKLWGMVAVFHALGSRLLARARGRRLPALHCAVAGLVVLALVKLVPYLGVWAWSAATFVGVGATLRTKFGRREPWFADPAPHATSLARG